MTRRITGGSGCLSKELQRAIHERGKNKGAEIIFHDGKRYEYRSDTQIYRHDQTKMVRIKKAEWLAIKAQQIETHEIDGYKIIFDRKDGEIWVTNVFGDEYHGFIEGGKVVTDTQRGLGYIMKAMDLMGRETA